jgi:3-hydroxy acid dehydrogenase/malonic semialdehyde reductase
LHHEPCWSRGPAPASAWPLRKPWPPWVAGWSWPVAAAALLEELAARLAREHASKCHVWPVDLMDPRGIREGLAALPADLLPVTVLVNNAGLAYGLETLENTDAQESETVFHTNVLAALGLIRELVPGMLAAGGGHVLNLGSIAGHQAYRGGGVYCASKAALLSA